MPFRVDSMHPPGQQAPENPATTEKSPTPFSQAFSQVQRLQKKELESFLSRLDSLGQNLADSLSLRDLTDFKNTVQEFLRSTLGQSRKMQEESFWDFRGRPKVLARITQINKALEELGEKVLSDQAKPIEILAKIDEIRGLLVDLLA